MQDATYWIVCRGQSAQAAGSGLVRAGSRWWAVTRWSDLVLWLALSSRDSNEPSAKFSQSWRRRPLLLLLLFWGIRYRAGEPQQPHSSPAGPESMEPTEIKSASALFFNRTPDTYLKLNVDNNIISKARSLSTSRVGLGSEEFLAGRRSAREEGWHNHGRCELGSDDFPWIISDKDHVTVLHNRFKVIMTEK